MVLEWLDMPTIEDMLDPIKSDKEGMQCLEGHTEQTLEPETMILELSEWTQELELVLVDLTLTMLEALLTMAMEQEELETTDNTMVTHVMLITTDL